MEKVFTNKKLIAVGKRKLIFDLDNGRVIIVAYVAEGKLDIANQGALWDKIKARPIARYFNKVINYSEHKAYMISPKCTPCTHVEITGTLLDVIVDSVDKFLSKEALSKASSQGKTAIGDCVFIDYGRVTGNEYLVPNIRNRAGDRGLWESRIGETFDISIEDRVQVFRGKESLIEYENYI